MSLIPTRPFGICLATQDFQQSHGRLLTMQQALGTRSVSPSVWQRLVYLVEKGRLAADAYDEVARALSEPNHVFAEISLSASVVEAMRRVMRDEVPDMPDRIVAASALHLGVPVISRDRRIRSANLHTIW